MSDPTPLINHVYEMYLKGQLHKIRKGNLQFEVKANEQLKNMGINIKCVEIFASLYADSAVSLPG